LITDPAAACRFTRWCFSICDAHDIWARPLYSTTTDIRYWRPRPRSCAPPVINRNWGI